MHSCFRNYMIIDGYRFNSHWDCFLNKAPDQWPLCGHTENVSFPANISPRPTTTFKTQQKVPTTIGVTEKLSLEMSRVATRYVGPPTFNMNSLFHICCWHVLFMKAPNKKNFPRKYLLTPEVWKTGCFQIYRGHLLLNQTLMSVM